MIICLIMLDSIYNISFNLKFTKGNCYGVIGANGAGKSTFMKVLSFIIPVYNTEKYLDSCLKSIEN